MKFEKFENKNHPYLALIRASENDERTRLTKKNKDCKLIESFEADSYVRLINCGTITRPIFVIPDVNDIKHENGKINFIAEHRLMIKDRLSWPKSFIDMQWL